MIVINCETYSTGAFFVTVKRVTGLRESVIYQQHLPPFSAAYQRDAILQVIGNIPREYWYDIPEAVEP